MEIDDLTTHFGGIQKTADAFGVTIQTIYHWKRHGIPPIRQEQAERLTFGKFRPVTRAVDALMAQ